MSAPSIPRLSEERYLAIERAAEVKSEYFDGQMFAMAGASFAHGRLIRACLIQLTLKFGGSGCEAISNDLRVRTGKNSLYTYPDIGVVCGKPKFTDDALDTLLNPTLIIEVLSESTEAKDRGFKFHQYQAIESLREYALVSQTEPRIEIFRRQEGQAWQWNEFAGLDAVARFTSVNCGIALSEIYAQEENAR